VALILNTSIFAYTVVMHNDSKIFDPVWQPDGFCISNKDVIYWNSHDLCLYFDTIAAILHFLLFLALKDSPGMEPANELVKFGIMGVFGHGLGHGAISKAMRDGITPDLDSSVTGLDEISKMSAIEAIYRLIPFLLFWILLLKASLPNASFTVILSMTAVSLFFNTMTPQRFGFTYVQTVLLLAFSLNQLLRPVSEKDSTYALYPVIVGFPISKWIKQLIVCSIKESILISPFQVSLPGSSVLCVARE
jgi:hypothetical protein